MIQFVNRKGKVMNLLKVIYYVDEKNEKIKPFVQEITGYGTELINVRNLVTQIEERVLDESEREMKKTAVYSSYYLQLMAKGYSYEDILEVLKNEIYKKIDFGKKKEIIGLREEVEFLQFASLQKEAILKSLTDLESLFVHSVDRPSRLIMNKVPKRG